MRWKLLVLGSAAFWAVMMGLLVDREVVPYFKLQSAPTYRTVLGESKEPVFRRYDLLLGAQKIGIAEEMVSFRSGPSYWIENRLRLDLAGFARALKGVRLLVHSKSEVNLDYELTYFRSSMDLGGGVRFFTNGFRKGEQFEVYYSGLGLRGTRTLEFPKGAMLSHNFVPVQGHRMLAVGQMWRTQMIEFDWLGGQPQFVHAYASVESREPREVLGRTEDVYTVEIRRGSPADERVDYRAGVTRDGTVVESMTTLLGKIEMTARLTEQKRLSEAEYRGFRWQIPQEVEVQEE
jgi:hypothetical protein